MRHVTALAVEEPIVEEIRLGTTRSLDDLVALICTAFARGDMLPGLPPADGASDSVPAVVADLHAGVRLWAAYTAGGDPLGCVRVVPVDRDTWQLRRLAVSTDRQRGGVGRLLIDGVAHAARVEGIPRLLVWAVVERGVPPYYSALGWLTRGHEPNPDKPLSEAVMDWRPDQPKTPLAYPWGSERAGFSGVLVSWFTGRSGTIAVLGSATGDAEAQVRSVHQGLIQRYGEMRFVGGDGWRNAGPGELAVIADRLGATADVVDGPVLLFSAPCEQVPAFTTPRRIEPDLLALWRVPLRRAAAPR
jgi:predicted N-acetyltransferase YhbS